MQWARKIFFAIIHYFKRGAREARKWFIAGGTFWVWLALFLVILAFFYSVPGDLYDRVRWSGAAFEFLGISTVVIGINRARRLFGKPSMFRASWIWLGEFRFIILPRPPVHLTASSFMGVGASLGVGDLRAYSQPKTMEERVDQLEKDVNELRDKVGDVDRKVDQKTQALRAEIEKETSARQAGDQGLGKRLEEGMVGDSSFELAGVFYLFLGLALTHLAPELANGLGLLGIR